MSKTIGESAKEVFGGSLDNVRSMQTGKVSGTSGRDLDLIKSWVRS